MGRQAGNFRRTSKLVSHATVLAGALAFALIFVCVQRPAQAQGVQTVLHARGRVFPEVGRGAAAIERDAAGHYYVLADPASVIWIYSAEGKRVGQIPSAQSGAPSGAAEIKFAVDFDRDAVSGRIFVADRGANAVKIFTADGALEASVPVNAPMSVVALANGEFAVVTLRSDHLVRVMNEHGKLLRSFGNISDAVNDPRQLTVPALGASANSEPGYAAGYPTGPPPTYAMDIGKLYSGGPGEIYFAFTSLKDPKFRKYDRFGYAGYEAEIPANALIPDIDHDKSQVQLGMRVSGMAGPGEMFSFGSMYSVGGGAPAFTANGGHGGGGRRGGGSGGGGSGGATPSSGAGPGGTASGGSSDTDPAAGATGSGDGSDLSGSLSANSNSGNTSYNSSSSSTPDFNALLGVGGPGGGFGAPGIFGPGFPGFGGGFGGGFEHHEMGAEAARGAGGAAGGAGSPAGFGGGHTGGPGGVENPGAGHGEFGQHYGRGGFRQEGLNSFAGVVKFTEREPDTKVKPVIHALGVDRASQQVWAAIGDMLLRFDRDGNLLDIYRVATTQGAALQPVGILVEPERILLVADPAGIYEFARPDKSQPTGNQALKPESPAP
jgi:hypothetical protein